MYKIAVAVWHSQLKCIRIDEYGTHLSLYVYTSQQIYNMSSTIHIQQQNARTNYYKNFYFNFSLFGFLKTWTTDH